MRATFIEEVLKKAENDRSIILLSGDIGYGVLDTFAQKLPDQFINFGINEQSMLSAAAGMAKSGLKPIVYSIGNFPTFRCLEQVRNDICYMNLDVTIVAIGAGLAYGTAGYSHHLIEDIGAVSTLPNIRIYSPADIVETKLCINSIFITPGPKYIRLGKGGEGLLTNNFDQSCQGYSILRGEKDFAIISTGNILSESIQLRELLGEFRPTLVSIYDLNAIEEFATCEEFAEIFVLEEHVLRGGFGSMLLEFDEIRVAKIQRFGIKGVDSEISGSQQFLRNYYNISAKSILPRVFNP